MSADTDGFVRFDLSADGRTATIVLDRAEKLNALTLTMLDQLERVCVDVARSGARVVIIRTAGDRVFCVGADINHFADLGPVTMWRDWVATGHRAFAAVESLPQPTIAVVDGLAFGGGLELALAADFRILSAGARVGLPETGLGTVPGWGGTERLTRLIGPHRTKEIVLTRRILNASEAFEWGIATRVAADDIDAPLSELLTALSAGAPVAVQLAKQIINAADRAAPAAVLEALASGTAAATADLAEGIAAFREKRQPAFGNA